VIPSNLNGLGAQKTALTSVALSISAAFCSPKSFILLLAIREQDAKICLLQALHLTVAFPSLTMSMFGQHVYLFIMPSLNKILSDSQF